MSCRWFGAMDMYWWEQGSCSTIIAIIKIIFLSQHLNWLWQGRCCFLLHGRFGGRKPNTLAEAIQKAKDHMSTFVELGILHTIRFSPRTPPTLALQLAPLSPWGSLFNRHWYKWWLIRAERSQGHRFAKILCFLIPILFLSPCLAQSVVSKVDLHLGRSGQVTPSWTSPKQRWMTKAWFKTRQ